MSIEDSYGDGDVRVNEKFETLEAAVEAIGNGGPHNRDLDFKSVGEFWYEVMAVGNVHFDQTEAHLEANDTLGEKFLSANIEEISNPEFKDKFSEEIEAVLDAVNDIYPLAGINPPGDS